MVDVEEPDATSERAEVRSTMLAAFGPVLKGSDLVRALGFDTMEALRQAKRQKRVGVTVFTAPARKGLFAYTCDVADWLCDLRMGAKGGEP
ncbi:MULTISPECIES: hypothetical protein [Sphingomonas]|uniref:hypothetical protein n=1 Tax=Sphingomonas TaxID=13687 RepID=UPI00254ECE4A|nr:MULTISPECIES: hypothetical protein [Sphingomonas]MDK8187290.1 hypothetical protein [Sphingomonas zeae]MDK8217032.1 hypothetical protein [Sphingomonas sp. UMB7805-LC452B]